MKHLFTPSMYRFLGVFLLLIASIPVTLYVVSQQQDIRNRAWMTSQSASAKCDSNGKAVIDVSFSNTEPQGAQNAMNVVAKDQQTNKEVNLGAINPGETKGGSINTDATSLNAGNVVFKLTWTNGRSGVDSRSAGYGAVSNCPQPTSPPTNTPVPPTVTSVPPTNTPVPPTATKVPPTSTPVPTNTPTPTPTDVPPTEVLPSPSGVTSCPVPTKVQNVRIECPYCGGQE